MQRQTHKFEVQTKRPASTNANPSPAHLRCPYTSGEVTKSSVCPLTGIDVSRTVHSEVLQDINAKVSPCSKITLVTDSSRHHLAKQTFATVKLRLIMKSRIFYQNHGKNECPKCCERSAKTKLIVNLHN